MSDTDFDIKFRDFSAEKEEAKREAAKSTEATERERNAGFQSKLFGLIRGLTVVSFVFLMLAVTFKIAWKIRHPDYEVISDMVINVLAAGVFAELVGVVGIIAKLLWQK